RVAELRVYVEPHGGTVRQDVLVQPQDADGVTLETVQVDPPTAHVELSLLDAPASRTLPVTVQYRGKPAPPFTVAEVTLSPAQVVVSGKSEQLVQMHNVSAA